MISNEKIAQQAKKIMDDFMSALDKAAQSNAEFKVRREHNLRSMEARSNTNPDFQARMLRNAPQTKDNLILAEKKKW